MRWLMLLLTLLGFGLAFVAKSPGLLALFLVLGFVGLFGLVFSLAAERVAASARPDSAMAGPEDLAAMRSHRTPPRPAPPAAPASVTKVSSPAERASPRP